MHISFESVPKIFGMVKAPFGLVDVVLGIWYLPCHSTVIQALFSPKFHHQSLFQIFWSHLHDLTVGFLWQEHQSMSFNSS